MNLSDLRGAAAGEDVYVIGSGASLDLIDPAFLDERVTVGVNRIGLTWRPVSYTVTKYHEVAAEVAVAFPDQPVIAPRYQHGNHDHGQAGDLPGNVVIFDHLTNPAESFEIDRDWPEDGLVVSWSTITTAMHFAAHLGARTILMLGHDCGALRGREHMARYPAAGAPGTWSPARDEMAWLEYVQRDSIAVRQRLRERYGARVYSVSPFLGLNRDGEPFEGARP